jgi:hypothetical protein
MRSRQRRKARMYVEIRCIGRHRFLRTAHLTQTLNLSKQIFFPDCIFTHTHFYAIWGLKWTSQYNRWLHFGRQMNWNTNPSSYRDSFACTAFRLAMGPTQPAVQSISGLKWPGYEAHYSLYNRVKKTYGVVPPVPLTSSWCDEEFSTEAV